MKFATTFLGLALLAACQGTRAQSSEPSLPKQQATESARLSQPAQQPQQSQQLQQSPQPQELRLQQEPRQLLPDSPIPTEPSPVDGTAPCPGGIGKPCALLAGRSYFPDRSRMTQHDRTWKDSLKNPLLLSGMAAYFGSFVWDYRTTRAAIDSGRCAESNPLMGQSRAQELGVSIALASVIYLSAAKMKKDGHGNFALGVLTAGTLLHVAAATHNRAFCHN